MDKEQVPRVYIYMLEEANEACFNRLSKEVSSKEEMYAAAFAELKEAVSNNFDVTHHHHRLYRMQAASKLWLRQISGNKYLCMRLLTVPGWRSFFDCSLCQIDPPFSMSATAINITKASPVALEIQTFEALNFILIRFGLDPVTL